MPVTTDWTDPGSCVDVPDGDLQWDNPNDAAPLDNTFATFVDAPLFAVEMDSLLATQYGFSIPAGATILGIECRVFRYSDGDGTGRDAFDQYVQTVKSGIGIEGDDKADTITPWPHPGQVDAAFKTYGSSSDLWGRSWTPDDINDPDFGISFKCLAAKGFVGSPAFPFIDSIQTRVTYEAGPGIAMICMQGHGVTSPTLLAPTLSSPTLLAPTLSSPTLLSPSMVEC